MRGMHRMAMLLVLGSVGFVNAQGLRLLEFQAGTLNPKGTRAAGLILGGQYGVVVDERVDIGIGLAVFHKGFTEKTSVNSGTTSSGTGWTTETMPLEYSTTLLPITINATVHFPFESALGLYAGGSLAYEFLFDKYTNHETDKSEKSTFKGFGWMARAGVEFFLGSRSSLTGEVFYNGCKVKGNSKEVNGIPMWDEVNVSGFGFRGGLRLELH
jgi:hypothetical protein